MDALTIGALTTGIVAIIVAITTHIKHSECCRGMFEMDTTAATESTPVISKV